MTPNLSLDLMCLFSLVSTFDLGTRLNLEIPDKILVPFFPGNSIIWNDKDSKGNRSFFING